MPRTVRDVVFVDGVRTPFGKAGPKGIYARDPRRRPGRQGASASCCAATRACRRSGSTRSPIAATTQIGDQGLTLGRTAAHPRRAADSPCPATPSTGCARAR